MIAIGMSSRDNHKTETRRDNLEKYFTGFAEP